MRLVPPLNPPQADSDHQRELVEQGLKWADEYGRPPRVNDWKQVRKRKLEAARRGRSWNWPSYQTAVRAFGTWDDYIRACGWEPRGRGRPRKELEE